MEFIKNTGQNILLYFKVFLYCLSTILSSIFNLLIVLPIGLIIIQFTGAFKLKPKLTEKDGKQLELYYCGCDFKKVITAIEFYQVKNGHYPENIDEYNFRDFLEKWSFNYNRKDILYNFLKNDLVYSTIENGYELSLNTDSNNIELEYPQTFWNGLGIVKTNIKGFVQSSEGLQAGDDSQQ